MPASFLTIAFLSTLAMSAACFVVGYVALNKAARYPVVVADVLSRSGRVHLELLAAGFLGVLIALIAEHRLPAESPDEETDG